MGNVSKITCKKNLNDKKKILKKIYDEESTNKYILEADVQYLKNLYDLHSDLPFLPERMKIKNYNKLVCNLYDKNNYVAHIRNLKQALNHGLIFWKVHKVIQFNQKAWFKSYIDRNTKLRTETKNDFEKDFLSYWIIQILEKLWKIYESAEMVSM